MSELLNFIRVIVAAHSTYPHKGNEGASFGGAYSCVSSKAYVL